MGVTYHLVNNTKRECIMFAHLGTWKMRELAGIPASSVLTTWYLLNNLGDEISFVSDLDDDWPFPGGSRADTDSYPDVTNRLIDELIEQGLLSDHGLEWVCEDEPDTIYIRDIRNAWCQDETS